MCFRFKQVPDLIGEFKLEKKMKTTTKSSSVVAIPTPGNYNDIAIATLTLL